MSIANVSAEIEMKAYRNSTQEIATLLDTSSQLDSIDVIITSIMFFWYEILYYRSESETCVIANSTRCCNADSIR